MRVRSRSLPVALLVVAIAALAARPFVPAAFAAEETMPDLVGRSEADAGAALSAAGLSARVRLRASEQPGVVLEQAPPPGAVLGAEPDIVLVVGAARIIRTTVPSVVGLAESDVLDALDGTYFLVIEVVATGEGENGTVIAQQPAAGEELFAHDVLRLRVLRRSVRVPAVLGLTEEGASSALQALGLKPEFKDVLDDVGAPGTVVAQDPSSGSETVPGARVRLAVARPEAVEPAPPAEIDVPSFVGLALGDAVTKASEAGLDLNVAYVPTSGTPNRVVAQHTAAGSKVAPNSAIDVDVSTAPPAPASVVVPPVEGLPRLAAVAALQSAGLASRVSVITAPGAAVDVVAQQLPPAGASVPPNSEVLLRIPLASTMPNLIGRTRQQAQQLLHASGLLAQAIRVGPVVPGVTHVVNQEIPAGVRVARGTRIRFQYEIQAPPVAVPPVQGMTTAQAQATLDGAGLAALLVQIGGIGPLTEVVNTQPPAGSLVPEGTVVTVRFIRKPAIIVTATVPNLIGRTKAQALALLNAADLGHQWQGPHIVAGAVVASQSHPAGAHVPKGTVVKAVFQLVVMPPGPGLQFRLVPDLVGKSKAQALAALNAADLVADWEGPHHLPGAKVSSQAPAAGTLVAKNSTVKAHFAGVILPPGALQTTVPNLIGKSKAQAQALLAAKNLVADWQGPHHLALARVSAQSKPAGAVVLKGSTIVVTFQLAIGPLQPLLVQVPNVLNKTEAVAKALLQSKGLQANVVSLPGFPPPIFVKSQNPAPGTMVAGNSTVTIVIKK